MRIRRVGGMRDQFAIQAQTEARGTDGGVTRTWATASTVWGGFVTTAGREFQFAQGTIADLTHMIRIRFYSGLTTTHRLTHDGRTFGILSIDNRNNRDNEMLLSCKEEV